MMRLLTEAREDREWIETNREMLERKYADCYVAVKNRRVIGYSPSLDFLLGFLIGSGHDPTRL